MARLIGGDDTCREGSGVSAVRRRRGKKRIGDESGSAHGQVFDRTRFRVVIFEEKVVGFRGSVRLCQAAQVANTNVIR